MQLSSRYTFDHDDYHRQDFAVYVFHKANKKGSLDVTGPVAFLLSLKDKLDILFLTQEAYYLRDINGSIIPA